MNPGRGILALVVVAVLCAPAGARDCPTSAGSTGTYGAADAIAVDGDHVYFSAWGLKVLDVSDPAAPAQVGEHVAWDYGLAISGTHAYGAGYDSGLHVYDISDPAAPALLTTFVARGTAMEIDVAGDLVYLVTEAFLAGEEAGLQIIDVTDPESPFEVGFWVGDVKDVEVVGGYAFAPEYTGGLRVVDVSDPSLPESVAFVGLSGNPYAVEAQGGYAYVAARWQGLIVVDVSDPVDPVEVGSLATADAIDVTVVSTTAYVADNFAAALRIIDVSAPSAPVEIGVWAGRERIPKVAAVPGYAYIGEEDGPFRVLDVDPVSGCPADIFADGFETGDTSGWSGSVGEATGLKP